MRVKKQKRSFKNRNLDCILWNVLSSLTKASDEFLEISVNILENKVKYSFSFFVNSLLNIHQPVEEDDHHNKIHHIVETEITTQSFYFESD